MTETFCRGFCPCENGNKIIKINGEAIKGMWVFGHPQYHISNEKITQIEICYKAKDKSYCFKHYDIIPETIGLFFGLSDKFKKKIFEGDVLHFKFDRNLLGTPKQPIPYVVRYNQNDCSYQIYPFNRIATTDGAGIKLQSDLATKSEIVGTIFDEDFCHLNSCINN